MKKVMPLIACFLTLTATAAQANGFAERYAAESERRIEEGRSRLYAESAALGNHIAAVLAQKFGGTFQKVSNSVFWDYNSQDGQLSCRAVVEAAPKTITFYCYSGDQALKPFRARY